MSLEENIQFFMERLKKGETKEQIALAIAFKNATKLAAEEEFKPKQDLEKKAYSPNKSFMDLLNDSERRNKLQSRADLESSWTTGPKLRNEMRSNKGGKRNTFITFVFAVIVVGCLSIVCYLYLKQPSNSSGKLETKDQGNEEQPVNKDLPSLPIVSDLDNSSGQISKKVTDLMKDFYQSEDLKHKASLCRLPNRTLADMKTLDANSNQSYEIKNVEIAPDTINKGVIKLMQTKITLEKDGVEELKYAYFTKDDSGIVKLDWHGFVGYEPMSWKGYLVSKDASSFVWHLNILMNGDLHPDYTDDKFIAINVRSWNPLAADSTNAMLSKEDPNYKKLLGAFQSGQKSFIFKVRHLGDIANSLVIEEIVSLNEFYENDIEATTE